MSTNEPEYVDDPNAMSTYPEYSQKDMDEAVAETELIAQWLVAELRAWNDWIVAERDWAIAGVMEVADKARDEHAGQIEHRVKAHQRVCQERDRAIARRNEAVAALARKPARPIVQPDADQRKIALEAAVQFFEGSNGSPDNLMKLAHRGAEFLAGGQVMQKLDAGRGPGEFEDDEISQMVETFVFAWEAMDKERGRSNLPGTRTTAGIIALIESGWIQ